MKRRARREWKRGAPKVALLATLVLSTACVDTSTGDSIAGGEAVSIEWYVGLGTGAQAEHIAGQEAIVDAFNRSQDDIDLQVTFVDPDEAHAVLRQRIADGDPPDVVGPVGILGSNGFDGEFLDLTDFLDEFSLDLYDPAQIDVWRDGDQVTAVPFGVYPAVIFYNRELFDRAGLPYPPAEFGEEYRGRPWDTTVFRALAEQLTLDVNGNHVGEAGYDPGQVIQFGFHHQWLADPRSHGTFFGPGSLVGDDGRAQIPERWLDEWRWYHDAMFRTHVAPDLDETESSFLGDGNAFATGRVAMAFTHTWYVSSIADAAGPLDFWDLAVAPSHDGLTTSKLHADTFRILRSTEHPDEAVDVLRHLLGPAAERLHEVYSSFPARLDHRATTLVELAERYPSVSNWDVIGRSLAHPDIPSHEAAIPGMPGSQDLITDFGERLRSEPDFDVEAEVRILREGLDSTFGSP